MTIRFRLLVAVMAVMMMTCRFAAARQTAAPAATPQPVPSPSPSPSPTPSAPAKGAPVTEAPPRSRKVPAEIPPLNYEGSTSQVPVTSTLYPGSTVGSFHGKDNFGLRVEGDLRYQSVTGEGESSGTYLSATRITGDWVRANPLNRDERGGVRLQALLETDQRGMAIRQVRLSEAYGYYTFLTGGVSARARVGQFVIPFGLLAVYDTALQPIQPIYDKALGLRVDTGVMLEGRYDEFRYAGSITNGTGPNRWEAGGDTILSFRLARAVTLPKIGPVEIGGSLLSGKLPLTTFTTELPPSGTTDQRGVVKSTRFGIDGQLFRDPWTVRGEMIFGGNGSDAVFGYFGEGDYRLTRTVTLVAYNKLWEFPVKPSNALSIGLGTSYAPHALWHNRLNLTFRALFEYERDVPAAGQGTTEVFHRLTLQTFVLY